MKRTHAVISSLSVALILLLAACSPPQNTRSGAPSGGSAGG